MNRHPISYSRARLHTWCLWTLRIAAVAMIVLLAASNASLFAQQTTPTIGDTSIRPFTLGGSVSMLSEGYAVSGIDPRRPAGLGQVRANANFTLFGLQSGVNLLYATNDNRLRQSMNQFHFHGSWRWITVSAGSVSPHFSQYSLSGVSVTGGMIDMTPGRFSLSLVGGRSKRAVAFSEEDGFRDPAFERWLYAARLGVGRRAGTSFGLSAVYAYDAEGSVEDPGAALPAENFSLTPSFNLSLFDDRLSVESNVTVSVFTRNKNSTSLGVEDQKGLEFFADVMTPRTSTRVDYAAHVAGAFRLRSFRVNGSWERVQPGFASLGLGHVRSDQQLFRFRTQLPLVNNRINVGLTLSSGNNNLMENKLSTLTRRQIGTNVNFRITQTFSLNAAYMRMSNLNEPLDEHLQQAPELHQEHLSQTVMMTPTLIVPGEFITHAISGTASYHSLDDKSRLVLDGAREASGFTNITTGLNYGASWPSNFSVNVSGNLLHNDTQVSKALGYSTNLSSGYGFLERRLMLNVGIGFSRNGIEFTRIHEDDRQAPLQDLTIRSGGAANGGDDFMEGEYVVEQWSNQYSLNTTLSYRLPNGNPLRLRIRGVSSRPGEEGGREYDEIRGSLQYTHRF